MISKNSILMCVLSAVLIVYLVFAMMITSEAKRHDRLKSGMAVNVADTLMTHFITAPDIIRESGIDPDTLDRLALGTFSLWELENHLRESDKVESVNAWIANDGRVHVDVVPMTPVARVFEKGVRSYYINSQGKKISAEPRYHLDVPVVLGEFDSVFTPQRLLPLLDNIARDQNRSSLVSTLVQKKNGDVIIIPTIVGHVINFGDTSLVDDKFTRLETFYRRVIPSRGWELYDTISVKWRGRVVATKRKGKLAPTNLATLTESDSDTFEEFDDVLTITDPLTVADGLAEE